VLPAQAYFKAQKLRALLRQQVLEALNRVDVLVLPTSGVAAPKVEPDPVIDGKGRLDYSTARVTLQSGDRVLVSTKAFAPVLMPEPSR
jgi:Asp-tRNA(Asn)/Glu-tRNA(Gln) amidotransferase A subunit family amidase